MTDIEGLYIVTKESEKLSAGKNDNVLSLLMRRDNLEVMTQKISGEATVWLSPADEASCVEFFYVLDGEISIHTAQSQTASVCLKKGDSFFAEGLSSDVRITTKNTAELLYISNQAMFDSLLSFQGDLNELLKDIDEKDNVTLKHSQNVMTLTVRLLDILNYKDLPFDMIAAAALFHDIGKCYTPDKILKKQGRLEPEEYSIMKRHAADSAAILRQKYGDVVANVAGAHHERLDGSGYPDGLTSEQIPFSAKVIAVADVYEAMTAQRDYNKVKTPIAAVEELKSLPEQFDISVVEALEKFVNENL